MNEYNNNSKKQESFEEKKCVCTSTHGLFVPNRQLSTIVAFIMLIPFMSFLGGYFFGSQYGAQEFADRAEQESFTDQIYASLCVTPQDKDENVCVALEENNGIEQAVDAEAISIEQNDTQITTEPNKSQEQFYAQLIGFGTSRAAHNFVQRMEKEGISTHVKTRKSKTAKGKVISWYQVVTEAYNNKAELLQLVNRIKEKENIKDTPIVTC
jgi:cell division protein FtsN